MVYLYLSNSYNIVISIVTAYSLVEHATWSEVIFVLQSKKVFFCTITTKLYYNCCVFLTLLIHTCPCHTTPSTQMMMVCFGSWAPSFLIHTLLPILILSVQRILFQNWAFQMFSYKVYSGLSVLECYPCLHFELSPLYLCRWWFLL